MWIGIGLTDTRAKSFYLYYFTNEKRYKSKIQKTKLVFCQEIRASANIVVGGEEGWSARETTSEDYVIETNVSTT